jgi:mRNA-degrading endonuclease RelE of RelBE toxin-antitoxin system
MADRLLIRRSAEKEIAELQPDLRDRVIEKIRALASTPRPSGCKKLSGEDRAWRIRIGNFRVIMRSTTTRNTLKSAPWPTGAKCTGNDER